MKKTMNLFMSVLILAGFLTSMGLFSDDQKEREKKMDYFSFAGKRISYDRKEVVSDVAVSSYQSDGRFTMLDEIWKPGFAVIPHCHYTHSEIFYIISGEVEWTVNGETHVMKAGDSLYIPPKAVHAVRVVGNQDLHTLMLYAPGGYEDQIEREKEYTEEQLKDPKIKAKVRKLDDFNPMPMPKKMD